MITTFYPPHIGGIEYHVKTLSEHLAERGHNITILTSTLHRADLCSWDRISDRIEVVRLKTFFPLGWPYSALSSQGFTLKIRSTIKQLVRRKKIDVIHAHGHHYYLTWRAIDVAASLKIPSVLTLHGLRALNPTDTLAQIEEEIFNCTIFRRELRKANAVIGLTPRIAGYAKHYGPATRKYFAVPNGVNYRLFSENRKNRFAYRRKYGIADDKIVVLFRGRFASVKGVLELANACKHVVKNNDRAFFLFVGGGPLARELTELLKDVEENSKVINWTPFNEIHELYLASDIFVLPSKSEALPLAILEAMAARLHIVTTIVGGIPEVLQTYPYNTFINQLSALDICKSILEAIVKTQTSVESKSHPPEYLKNFDWSKIASQVEEVYEIATSESKL